MAKSQSRAAYYKQNAGMPITRTRAGWARYNLATRMEWGIRHLMRTPKGAFRADPNYGSPFERMRTQGFTEGMVDLARAEMRAAVETYLPDVMLHEVSIRQTPETGLVPPGDTKVEVLALWTLRSGAPTLDGQVATPNETTVVI